MASGSENLISAVNQQERPVTTGILRDFTPGSKLIGDDKVRAAWRHAGVERNAKLHKHVDFACGVTT
jgi:hypothetical protein